MVYLIALDALADARQAMNPLRILAAVTRGLGRAVIAAGGRYGLLN
jgi:hypothetical protein